MTFQEKEKSRRAKSTPQQVAITCCSAYRLPNGAWQADRDANACEAMARQLGTLTVREAQRPEDYFAMVPQVERKLVACPAVSA